MSEKDILGFIAVAIGFFSYVLYIVPILRRRTKPHAFTWIVWSLSESIACAAQYSRNAGPGAWATALSAVASISIAVMALSRGEKNITRSDWLAFIGGLAAIPLWYFTRDPLGAVILVSFIDTSAYFPTFRKSFHKPLEEPAWSYFVGSGKYIMALLAMRNYSLVTALYPSCIVFMNILMILLLLYRRAVFARVTK
jgi:hypothetical protein